jgi:hypothetical protein
MSNKSNPVSLLPHHVYIYMTLVPEGLMTSPMLEDGLVPVIPFFWLDGTGLLRNGSREQNVAIMVARDFVGTFMQGHYFI